MCGLHTQLCEWYWCSLNTQQTTKQGGCVCLCRFSSLAVTAQWVVPGPSCLHCRFLTLATVELQSATGTGCPFLAGERPAVLAMPVSAYCDGHQSTVQGEGRATSPAFLGPSSGAPQSLMAAGTSCCGAQSSHQSSRQGHDKVKTISRSITMVLVSSLHPPPTVGPSATWTATPMKESLVEGISISNDLQLWSSDSSAYWFLSVIQCRRGGILAAVKEPTAAQFFLFQSGGISSYSGCYLTILSEAKCYKKELTTRSSYNVKLPQSCPS